MDWVCGASPQPPVKPRVVVEEANLVSPAEGSSGEAWGMVAEFETPGALLKAAENLRDQGYKTLDAYTPYPIHGMVRAIGMGRSPNEMKRRCLAASPQSFNRRPEGFFALVALLRRRDEAVPCRRIERQ